MPKIKAEYGTAELAEMLGISRQALDKRAANCRWKSAPRQGQGGGKVYPFVTLPEEVRQAIIADAYNTVDTFIHNPNLPLDELDELFRRFWALPEKYQMIAKGRAVLLDLVRHYRFLLDQTVEAARKVVTELFAAKRLPDLPDEVYKYVKTTSPDTLERWHTAFTREGLVGLAPRTDRNGRDTKVTPEMNLFFRSAIAAKPHIRGCHLLALMKANFAPDQWVHKATVDRWFARYKLEYLHEYALSLNPIKHRNCHHAAFGSKADAPHAGHTWEMDSTPADVMTSDGKRCAIVGTIDVYSRRAVVVVANTSNSDTVAACMRKGLLTWGKPETIRKDNGADYSSKHIEAITSGLKIETPELPPYTPEAKGFIERFFGTLTRDLEEMLPGYTGHTVSERAALRERATWARKIMERPEDKKSPKKVVNIPLSQAELMHFIECWLDVYENRVHTGFANEPGRKLKGLTPRQAYEGSEKKPAPFRNERLLDILLAKVGIYTVQKTGLRVKGGRYVDGGLVPWVGKQVLVTIHPDDAGAVCVFDLKRDFICIARDEALTGQRLEEYLAARKSYNKKLTASIKAARMLSENMNVSYTANLVTGKITSAIANNLAQLAPPVREPEGIVEFVPEYQNEVTLAAQKAVDAYDGKARPVAGEIQPPIDFEKERRKKIETLFPTIEKNVQNPEASAYPDPIAYEIGNSATKLFAYYLRGATGDRWMKRADVWHIFHLWDNYTEVQQSFPRPDEDRLNIIEPEQQQEEVKL